MERSSSYAKCPQWMYIASFFVLWPVASLTVGIYVALAVWRRCMQDTNELTKQKSIDRSPR